LEGFNAKYDSSGRHVHQIRVLPGQIRVDRQDGSRNSVVVAHPADAQTPPKACPQSDVAAAMAAMSAKLKTNNQDNQARLKLRLRELAKAKGWSEAETEEKGFDLLEA